MTCEGLHTRMQEMHAEDLAALKRAVQALEHPSFAAVLGARGGTNVCPPEPRDPG